MVTRYITAETWVVYLFALALIISFLCCLVSRRLYKLWTVLEKYQQGVYTYGLIGAWCVKNVMHGIESKPSAF